MSSSWGAGWALISRRHGGGAKINVGRDCRLSSTRLRDALVKGLLAAGCDVTDIGDGAHAGALLFGAKLEAPTAPS